jgi:predicted AAA+ superfamily ATPase
LLQNRRINLDETLIVFDEIQFCNKALTSLKYFRENRPEVSIVAAGSLLGIALSKPLSFPVGQVDFLDLYPMTFTEFLAANGEDLMVETLAEIKAGEAIPASIHPHLIDLLSTYYFVGGMPEVVASWANNHEPDEVARIQKSILDSYELDFAKHAPDRAFEKLSSIWHAVPAQLARDNKKFIFSHVRAGARGRDLEGALQWLISAGLLYKVPKIDKPGMPLSAYTDDSFFKLYLCDVGLLRAMADIPLPSIKQKDPFFSEFRGAFTENFVLTELVAQHINPVFWKSKQAAEVDFICRIGQQIVPIEVKADENVRSRSLAVYLDKYSPSVAVRLSAKNAGMEPPLYSEPLYLAFRLSDWF